MSGKGCRRKRSVLNLGSRLGIFVARLSKMAENLSQDLDLNLGPTKYQRADSHVGTWHRYNYADMVHESVKKKTEMQRRIPAAQNQFISVIFLSSILTSPLIQEIRCHPYPHIAYINIHTHTHTHTHKHSDQAAQHSGESEFLNPFERRQVANSPGFCSTSLTDPRLQ